MDDPTWLDYAGFLFNSVATVAGLAGFFLAIRAYRVGVDAYRVAKEQGRRSFETQLLRELLALTLDDEAREDLLLEPNMAFGRWGVRAHLAMLPKSELPIWRELGRFAEMPAVQEIAPQYAKDLWEIPVHRRRDYEESLIANCLRKEIYDAIRERVG
ncbi:hypothetical protein [Micromonospora aurantiaca]|uniref:hypothetical protein n=1 Tax=Micromonospora aurantiaca (nom. illeg.) TaxID=47850 RepID=UPI0038300B3A